MLSVQYVVVLYRQYFLLFRYSAALLMFHYSVVFLLFCQCSLVPPAFRCSLSVLVFRQCSLFCSFVFQCSWFYSMPLTYQFLLNYLDARSIVVFELAKGSQTISRKQTIDKIFKISFVSQNKLVSQLLILKLFCLIFSALFSEIQLKSLATLDSKFFVTWLVCNRRLFRSVKSQQSHLLWQIEDGEGQVFMKKFKCQSSNIERA